MTADETEREIASSLTDAGIGVRFHKMKLADHGPIGVALRTWFLANTENIKSGGSACFVGLGMTDLVTTMACALHVRGYGSFVAPLVRVGKLLGNDDFRERLSEETRCLFIMAAQDGNKGCPLYDNRMAELEWMIRTRYDNRQSTFIVFPVDNDRADLSATAKWWSEETVYFLKQHFAVVRKTDLLEQADEGSTK